MALDVEGGLFCVANKASEQSDHLQFQENSPSRAIPHTVK